MAKIQTVNIVEYADDDLLGVTSYEDNEEGNKEAEAQFKQCVIENGADMSDEDAESFIEDGYFEQGNYQLFITHSNM